MSFTNLLNEYCEIQARTESRSQYGDIVYNYATQQSQVPCRITTAPSSYKIEDGNYKTSIRKYILFVDKEIQIAKGNRIIQGTEQYEVVDVQAYNDNVTSHHKEAYIIKIENK